MEDDPENNDYEFLRELDDSDEFYLPTNQHNPEVIVKVGNKLFLWCPQGLYHLTLTPVVID